LCVGLVEKRQDQDRVRPSHRPSKKEQAQAVKRKPLHFPFSLAAANVNAASSGAAPP
jgi:hypothetical protein